MVANVKKKRVLMLLSLAVDIKVVAVFCSDHRNRIFIWLEQPLHLCDTGVFWCLELACRAVPDSIDYTKPRTKANTSVPSVTFSPVYTG